MFTACGPGERQADLSATDEAVLAASPRVVRIMESGNSVDGLGTDIYYELQFDSKKAVSADELDAILEAIWKNAPFEPNGITLTAYADGAGEVPVDLVAAAAGLEPDLFSSNLGPAGHSFIGMWKRYGDWKKPS